MFRFRSPRISTLGLLAIAFDTALLGSLRSPKTMASCGQASWQAVLTLSAFTRVKQPSGTRGEPLIEVLEQK